jgi:hypothetical protein
MDFAIPYIKGKATQLLKSGPEQKKVYFLLNWLTYFLLVMDFNLLEFSLSTPESIQLFTVTTVLYRGLVGPWPPSFAK